MIHFDEKKLREAYLEEVNELLESLNQQLLALEINPEEKEIINEIFRLTHSIKSESALVGYINISNISHKMEDIFDKIRKNTIKINRNVMNSLFKSYDKILELINVIQNGGDESNVDISNEIDILNNILEIKDKRYIEGLNKSSNKKDEKLSIGNISVEGEIKQIKVLENEINQINIEFTDIEISHIEDNIEKGDIFYKITVVLDKDCEMRYPRAYLVYNNFENIGIVIKSIPNILLEGDDKNFSTIEFYITTKSEKNKIIESADIDQVEKVEISKINFKALKKVGIDLAQFPGMDDVLITDDEIFEAEKIEKEWQENIENKIIESKKQIETSSDKKTTFKGQELKLATDNKTSQIDINFRRQTIRVDTDRLDLLMNLVGELIINQSRFIQIKNSMNEKSSIQMVKAELEDAASELDRIADQMQSSMMLVRMIPIGTVFSRFPRMVRDLANNLQKNVKLNISGENTEIDKAIIELITEPLTHIIRNSIDHGIEEPEVRSKNKKSREGIIELRAFQQGSNIYIEISDDGSGINFESIKNEGINKGLITPQQASKITEEEIYSLMFEPGFSTKDKITGLSGRGVGLDVVRKQIEKLRGIIEIDSTFGKGTKFTIILPLTLTILEAMLVNIGENLFAIPVNVIEETLLIKNDEIQNFDEYKVYDLRNETVAILFLSELVGFKPKENVEEYFVVIVSYEHRKIGLVVDELIGHQDIVIKPLDESLKTLEGIAGATVLGDGKIALILDVNMLVRSRKRELDLMGDNLELFQDSAGGFDEFYDDINKPGDNKEVNKNILELEKE